MGEPGGEVASVDWAAPRRGTAIGISKLWQKRKMVDVPVPRMLALRIARTLWEEFSQTRRLRNPTLWLILFYLQAEAAWWLAKEMTLGLVWRVSGREKGWRHWDYETLGLFFHAVGRGWVIRLEWSGWMSLESQEDWGTTEWLKGFQLRRLRGHWLC